MNRKILIIIVLAISFSLLLPYSRVLCAPTSHDVKVELRKILEKDKVSMNNAEENAKVISIFFDKVISMLKYLKYPAIIVLIILVITGLYFVVKSIMSSTYDNHATGSNMSQNGGSKNNRSTSPFEIIYQRAISLSKEGTFDEAIIMLHKATVEFLKENLLITRNKEYTNNDIRRNLQNKKNLLNPFSIIAHYAEKATFSNGNLNKSLFSGLLTHFKKGFIDGK